MTGLKRLFKTPPANDANEGPAPGGFVPSKYQKAVFEAVQAREHNLLVSAVAGSGKSTVLVKSLALVPATESVLALAFNKKIADELGEKVRAAGLGHVTCATLHSVGLNVMRNHRRSGAVDGRKNWTLAKEVVPFNEKDLRADVVALAGKAKNHGMAPMTLKDPLPPGVMPDRDENWRMLADLYDIDLPFGPGGQRVINYARQILMRSVTMTAMTDYDEMLWLPVILDMTFPKYDRVLCDEVQDVSSIQMTMIKKLSGPDTRYLLVGDRSQSLYSFRGADSRAMDRIKTDLNCVELPLSITYRCPKSVVREAQKYDPSIEAKDDAIEGSVQYLWKTPAENGPYQPGDMVACRYTAPLVKLAYALLAKRIPVHVAGKDIGKSLIAVLQKACRKRLYMSRAETLEALKKWFVTESEKAEAEEDKAKLQAAMDKFGALEVLVLLDEVKTAQDVVSAIENLFQDSDGGKKTVNLGTVHRFKGAQAKRVFVLNYRLRYAQSSEENKQQELNNAYVSVTRAQESLFFIYSPASIKAFYGMAMKKPQYVDPDTVAVCKQWFSENGAPVPTPKPPADAPFLAGEDPTVIDNDDLIAEDFQQ